MNKWNTMLSVIVIASALAGCGGQDKGNSNEALRSVGGARMGMMGTPADLMGKIKSIRGQTITLYKSALRSRGSGQGSTASGDDQLPPDGMEIPADGERKAAPEGAGRMDMDTMFTDETVDVQVTDTTKIVSMTFENDQMVEKEITIADLKEDDILSVMLKDDTQEAESITVRSGGFGGGGQPPQQEQQTSTK